LEIFYVFKKALALASPLCGEVLRSQRLLRPQQRTWQNTLSLDAALRMALEHSQTLAAKDQAVLAAQALSVAAAQLPDPSLKLGVNNLPVTGADKYSLTRDFMTMRSVGLAQEWVRADKRQALSARYDSEAQVALAQRRMSEQDIQRETAQAWLTLHFQQRVHQLLNLQSQEMALQLQSVQAAYRVLKASQADVLSARLALAQVKDQLAQSQRLLALG
jgi:outer membrane protein TolC